MLRIGALWHGLDSDDGQIQRQRGIKSFAGTIRFVRNKCFLGQRHWLQRAQASQGSDHCRAQGHQSGEIRMTNNKDKLTMESIMATPIATQIMLAMLTQIMSRDADFKARLIRQRKQRRRLV